MSDEATAPVPLEIPRPYLLTADGISIIDQEATWINYVGGGGFVRLSTKFIEAVVINYLRENEGRHPEGTWVQSGLADPAPEA